MPLFVLKPCLVQTPDGVLSAAPFSAPPLTTGTAAASASVLHSRSAATDTLHPPDAYTTG